MLTLPESSLVFAAFVVSAAALLVLLSAWLKGLKARQRQDSELERLRSELALVQAGNIGLGKKLLELSREMKARPAATPGDQSEVSGMRAPQTLSEFEQAQTLLEDGVAIEQVVQQTGLTRSEAELVQLLHRPQMATDFSADALTAFR